MASLIHDTSPILRHSLQQSHNKGLYYGFRDAILSRLERVGGHCTRELYMAIDGQSIGSRGGSGSYSQL